MLFITELELAQLSGFTALLSVCIGFFFGFIVLIKSIKVKDLLIFNFFLCIIFTLSPWYPSGLGYVYWLINNRPLDYDIYVLVGIVAIPIAILAWLNVYMTTVKPTKKKIILSLYAIFSIAFEIYLFYFLYFAPGAPVESLLGIKDPTNPVDIDYKGFVLVYLGVSILTACTTGIHFAIKSIKEKGTPSLLWKGRFLLAAFILFGISAIFDAIVQMDQVLLIIMRIILVMSNLFFYIGFILPKWVEKILSIREGGSEKNFEMWLHKKNMLLLFIIAFVFDVYVGLLAEHMRDFLVANPVITMLLVGVLPILIEAGIALLLAKKNIIIKI